MRVLIYAKNTLKQSIIAPSLFEVGENLLELLATGRTSLSQHYHDLLMSILKAGYWSSDKDKHGPYSMPQKLGVFALEMLAATRNETIDWDSYGIPADRFWLECARTGLTETHLLKVAEWMTSLCDAHVQSSNVAGDSGGTDVLEGHEIDDPTHFLWPITVHAFIKLRLQMDLDIPQEIDHPLMRTSFAPFAGRGFGQKTWKTEPWFVEVFDIAAALETELNEIRLLVI